MPGIFFSQRKTIMVLEERVRKAITSEEAAWLYNELSRAHTETKEYGLAKAYARKCMVEARACDNAQWVVSAMMQLVRLNILQHNKNEAKNQLRDVVEVARKIGDEELADYCEKVTSRGGAVLFVDVEGFFCVAGVGADRGNGARGRHGPEGVGPEGETDYTDDGGVGNEGRGGILV